MGPWNRMLWYMVVLAILALIAAVIIIFYIPLVNQGGLYRAVPTIAIIVTSLIGAYLIHKKILPKPTTRDRLLNLLIIAIVLVAAFIYVWLTKTFG
jgi:predicted membrane-bound mannosyltransferase